jgi:hypothetical protein
MKLSNYYLFNNSKPKRLKTKLSYQLKFASIIAPGSISNLRLIQKQNNQIKNPHGKLIVKQSYLLLT